MITLDQTGFSITSTFGTLNLWLANNFHNNRSNIGVLYVYDSNNLSNLVTAYDGRENFVPLTSSSDSFSIYSESHIYLSYLMTAVFRITERQFSNCNDTNYIQYAYFFDQSYTLNMAANSSGSCLSSILLPNVNADDLFNLPTIHIKSLSYTGPSSVKVLSTIYNESYELFEFFEENCEYWNNSVIYGNLINFLIPANGTLEVEYESWESPSNITDYDFEDYGVGIVQSIGYPMEIPNQNLSYIIKCIKGVAKIHINIISVDIPPDGYFLLNDGNQIEKYLTGFENQTIEFNSDTVTIIYYTGENNMLTTGQWLKYGEE